MSERVNSALPRCLRCGDLIPARLRDKSDYCSTRCRRQQIRDDEQSIELERVLQDSPDGAA